MSIASLQTGIISYKGDVLTGPGEVAGFEDLDDDNKVLFEKFLHNFYEALEFPEKHRPVQVRLVPDENPYLRVDFKSGCWLHIQSPTIWY